MRRKILGACILAVLMSLIPSVALADKPLEPKALEISNNLNCPVCEGQSIRDSNAQLARDMRRTVQEMLDEGHTEDEIYDYFVERYGVGILRNPPKSGFFMTLWWMPVIGVAIGALVLGTFITQRKRPGTRRTDESEDDSTKVHGGTEGITDDELSEYEARLNRELSDSDQRDRRP